jgi:alkanesulfonate monooxygenase SsuD/methylene tetrahydromethanopterin reductase-like flavin-dependent oxidoreductase (luciferase family)
MAQLLGDRLIMGWGAGTFDNEFKVIGWGDYNRVEMVRSNAEILRKLLSQDNVSHSDEFFSFENVTIQPRPNEPVQF